VIILLQLQGAVFVLLELCPLLNFIISFQHLPVLSNSTQLPNIDSWRCLWSTG